MKRSILLSLSALFIYILASSYSQGPGFSYGINCTGSYNSQNSCSGANCHGANDGNVVVDIQLKDLNGNVVDNSRYFPEAYYWVKVHGYISSGNYPYFGFQFSASSEFKTGGTTQNQGSNKTSVVVGSAIIMESIQPIPTNNNAYADSFLWQAPKQGAGKWTVFATVLMANGNSSPTGDKGNNYQRVFYPIPASVTDLGDNVVTALYPNPCTDRANLSMTGLTPGEYSFIIIDGTGRIITSNKQQIHSTDFSLSLNTAGWTSGSYKIIIGGNGGTRAIAMLKQ